MDGVNTHHSDFDKYADKWRKCRDFADGQAAVRAAGEKYLAKNGAEEADAYKSRVGRSDLYNATWVTLKTLLGLMFRKDPTLEVPASIEPYLDDIDMAGTSLGTFARKVGLDALEVGRLGIMVDHPVRENVEPISVAVAEQQGLRPSMQFYRSECIINWATRRVGNRTVLSLVVLKEQAEERENEFKAKEVDQWRVLDLTEAGAYRQRVFRKREGGQGQGDFEQIGDDMFPRMGGRPLDFIPFFIVGTDGVNSETDEPPLIDLVDANEAHYQVNSDLRTTLHFGVPTFCISGMTQDENSPISVGSRTAIILNDPQAKAYFAEPSGPMVPEMRNTLKDLENRMAMLGARMLQQEKAAAEAAETAAIKRQGEDASLADIAQAVGDAIERALTVFAMWAGAGEDVTYQLNRDYNPSGLSPAQLTALLKAVQAGEMSSQSFFDLMQRHDVVDAELTYEEEQERIGAAGPARPVLSGSQGAAA